MLNHIQEKLTNPLESRRLMEITIKNYFVRDNTNVGTQQAVKHWEIIMICTCIKIFSS